MNSYTIGRATDNDIVVDEPSISRRHAELIDRGDGRYRLRDLGSSNGTQIQRAGGWQVVTEVEIDAGTSVRLGQAISTVEALLALAAAAAAAASPADGAQANGRPPQPARYDVAAGGYEVATAVDRTSDRARHSQMPGWYIPVAAIGGGAVLIAIVVIVLLVGPLGPASAGDFAAACGVRGGSQERCKCWAGALKKGVSGDEFGVLARAVRKRDWRTALPPELRTKLAKLSPAIEARCGALG